MEEFGAFFVEAVSLVDERLTFQVFEQVDHQRKLGQGLLLQLLDKLIS